MKSIHVFPKCLVLLFWTSVYLGDHTKASEEEVERDDDKEEGRWIDLKNISFSFDCYNKAIGFYADVEYDCQIFHMCDEAGRRVPHLCANDTSFNQEYRICDWSYNFDCSEAPKWYYLNELTYATDPPPEDEDYHNR